VGSGKLRDVMTFVICRFRLAFVAAGIGAFLSGASAAEWSLVWSDEFAQPDGSAPDSTKWVYDLGAKKWGNNELQTYTDRRENCRIQGGKLIIEARKEPFTGADGIRSAYTSARLKTQGKAAWTFGRLEARIKLPRGQSIWPAFWMLGTDIASVDWPACGEIDIMENIGREPLTVHGTIHGPGYSGHNGIGGAITNHLPVADDFHLFAVEWEPARIQWFFDSNLYFTVTPTNLPSKKRWVFDQAQFCILNLAVGGDWPGNPDETTSFPQRMEVDYIRVYFRTNTADTKAGLR